MSNKNNHSLNTDEILFKDETGKIRVLKGGKILTEEKEMEVFKEKVKEKVVEPLMVSSHPLDFNQLIEEIYQESGLTFKDKILEDRFKKVILSRLKDVRNQLETKERLLRATKVGGLELAEEQANKVLEIIAKKLPFLNYQEGQKVAKLKSPAEELKSPDFDNLPKIIFKKIKEPAVSIDVGEIKKREALPPLIEEPAVVEPEKAVVVQPKVARFESPLPKKTTQPIKPITFAPKTLGPIDEIREMSLVDFRRFSPNPQEAAEKVLEKIQLLEKDSFNSKFLAIKAWQQSEVYQLYVQLGRQSMEQKISVSEIIKQRQRLNQSTLTQEEFEAVMDLNERLRF